MSIPHNLPSLKGNCSHISLDPISTLILLLFFIAKNSSKNYGMTSYYGTSTLALLYSDSCVCVCMFLCGKRVTAM